MNRTPANTVLPLRSLPRASAAALTAGAVFGVLSPLLEPADAPALHALHLVLNAGWSWSALAFCVGLRCPSMLRAAVLAPASLIAAVIAYYTTKLGQSDFRAVNILSSTAAWCIAAAFFGPILGVAGNLARHQGMRGLPFQVLIPLAAVVETSTRLRVEASLQGALVGATWNVTRVVAVAVVVVLVGRTVTARRQRPRTSVAAGRRIGP
ncbi:DUF6518 family protein [Streptomyces sp. NPDC004629]|uniref:DUF6518 family protein n=1 Tax=Streptomyces sp. NPDC004629 TaxID=3364705 RepID=UPI0036AE3E8C